MKTVPFFTPTASLMAVALGSFPLMAEESHRHTAPDAVSQDDTVMVVTAPVVSPLEVVTSPKTPRQPVPASDGSDYLKTIGFLANQKRRHQRRSRFSRHVWLAAEAVNQ